MRDKILLSIKRYKWLKKSLLITNFSLLMINCFAQQIPVLNQSLYNSFLFNPANAGLKPYTQLFLNVRDQWTEMPDAPFYTAISIDGRLKNERSGIGFQLQNDKQPMISNTSGLFTYRYTVKFNQDHSLRMALSAGLLFNSINLLNADAAVPTESTLQNKDNAKAGFDANAGLVYQYKRFELGVASLQLTNTKFDYINDATQNGATYNLTRCFNVSATYSIPMAEDWSVVPSAIMYSTQGMPIFAMISAKVEYLKDFWTAVSYRTDKSIAFSLGTVLSNKLNIGYSFELPVNTYAANLGYTHEFTLGIRLFTKGNEPASYKDISRKEFYHLANVVQTHSQQMDEMTQQVDVLKETDVKHDQRFDSQKKEIETLIAHSIEQRDAIDKTRETAVDINELDTTAQETSAKRYIVVLAAYNNLDDAKLFQKILERELGIITQIFVRNKGQARFLIYSRIVKTKQAALSEYDRLYDMDVQQYKQGNLWLYPIN